MARNTELLEQVMQHIVDHPEQHDQREWARQDQDCGTAACFAGWAAIFTFGDEVAITDLGFACPAPYDPANMTMPTVGATLLGLSEREATSLFSATNTADMLRLMVKDLVNGDTLREPEHYRESE